MVSVRLGAKIEFIDHCSLTENGNITGNDHYLSVIVVVIEGKYRNATHFYGLVPLGTDQSAEAQFLALKSRFEADGVWDSIKANLVALVM